MDNRPRPNGHLRIESAKRVPGTTVTVNDPVIEVVPWGYLREIRIVFKSPVPNMDASRPLQFVFKRPDPRDEHFDYEVTQVCESVET